MLNKDFIFKFTLPELKVISGKFFINIFYLTFFLLLVLTSIGLSNGAIEYLNKQMNSPYVNLVSVKIPSGFDISKVNDLENLKGNFGIEKAYPVFEDIRNFINLKDKKIIKRGEIRMGIKDDPIYDYVKTKNDLFKYKDYGCIVTREFLRDLGYCTCEDSKICIETHDVPFLTYRRKVNQNYVFINIPVQDIIQSLPDDLDVIVGERFYKALENDDFWIDLTDINESAYVQYFVEKNNSSYDDFFSEYDFKQDQSFKNFVAGTLYKKTFKKNDSLFQTNINSTIDFFKNKDLYRVYDFYKANLDSRIDPSLKNKFVFQINRNSLGEIRNLNDHLMSSFIYLNKSLKIDLSIINAKENFEIIKSLVELLSIAIKFLSILSIFLYLRNLIITHINNNKKNLGTLKAFGLANSVIIYIYSFISIFIIAISFLISYFITFLFGNEFTSFLTNIKMFNSLEEMKFINEPIGTIMIVFIVVPAILTSLVLFYKLRNKTPGDLIYERNNN